MCISLHAHVIITHTFQIFNIRNSNNVDALHILELILLDSFPGIIKDIIEYNICYNSNTKNKREYEEYSMK